MSLVSTFNIFLAVMAIVAVFIFLGLYFIDAGYGKFYNPKWGPSVDNHVGWVLMEAPVFIAMLALWWFSDRRTDLVRLVFLALFELHYFHRSFVFPRHMHGHNRMPWAIVIMGALFNTLNAFMQGGWIFYVSPADRYPASWLLSLPFIAGTLLFFAGMYVNIQSDGTTSGNGWNGPDSPSSPGPGPAPSSRCGPSPTWRPAPPGSTTCTTGNSRSSWTPGKSSASSRSSIDLWTLPSSHPSRSARSPSATG